MLILLPLGLLSLIGSPFAFVRLLHEEHNPLALAASAVFAFAPLMLFGWAMVMMTLFTDRKLSVSRHEIRVHRWVGGTRTIEISALKHIVLYGNPARLVLLPAAGPPLLSLDANDFSPVMPTAIGDHLRMEVERLGEIDKDELRAMYPQNAKEKAQRYGLENERPSRTWQW